MQHNKFWKAHSCPESQEIPQVSKALRFTFPFTKNSNMSLSWAGRIQSTPFQPISLIFVLTLPSHLGQGLPNSLPFRFPHQNPIRTYLLLYSTQTPYPLTSSVRSFLALVSSCLLPLEAQTSSSAPCSWTPSALFLLQNTTARPYKTIGKFPVLYVLIFMFPDRFKSEILMTLNWTVDGSRQCLI